MTKITVDHAGTLALMFQARKTCSDAAIASHYGITRQRVHQLLGPRPKPRAKLPATPPAPTIAEFAACLKAWRIKHSWSQAQAAERLRVDRQTVSRWETGAAGCSLAATVMEFMFLVDDMSTDSV